MADFAIEKTKGDFLIVAAKRSLRPKNFGKKVDCPFDVGNESITPPTRLALPSENWRVRAFENAFPFLQRKGKFRLAKGSEWDSPAWGDHEVIVETNVHGEQFENFSSDQLRLCLAAYERREGELYSHKGVKYAFLFKNHGKAAGASIPHEHSQIISLPFVPPVIAAEEKASAKKCLHCELLRKERKNALFENDYFAAVRPSYARFPFEFWIVSKEHQNRFSDFDEAESDELMQALQESAKRCLKVSQDYNFFFHAAPPGGKLHFHVEVVPRTNVWAGAELGAGIIINSRAAKQAIEQLKA